MIDQTRKILAHLHLKDFTPLPGIRSAHAQTIAGTYWPQAGDTRDHQLFRLQLRDGDCIVVAENRPKRWNPGGRCAVLVHGLTGCYQSNYMVRLMKRLNSMGILVVRVNLRCSGPGFGLAKQPYHCGISDDTRVVLNWLKNRYPTSPVTQIGFSLGGNITLKMAGEDGEKPTGNLDSVIAVSPPMDLHESAEMMERKENRFFDRYFVQRLRREVDRLHAHFQWPKYKFPTDMSIRKFDDHYTAPVCGFKDAMDYYEKCSSKHFIGDIRIPTLIVGAIDDPIVASQTLLQIPQMKHVDVIRTAHGGHVGFIGFGGSGIRWSDDVVVHWLSRQILGQAKVPKPAMDAEHQVAQY